MEIFLITVIGSWGQKGTSSDKATSRTRSTSVWGMTAMAVVSKLPGIGNFIFFPIKSVELRTGVVLVVIFVPFLMGADNI